MPKTQLRIAGAGETTGETSAFTLAVVESSANAAFGTLNDPALVVTHAFAVPDSNELPQFDGNAGATTESKFWASVIPGVT